MTETKFKTTCHVEAGDVVLMAFALSLLVAFASVIVSGIIKHFAPVADVSVLGSIGFASLIVFVVTACIIGCASD